MKLPLRSFPVASSVAQGGVFGGAQSAAGISPIPFLLSDYPDAAAAYSLRDLVGTNPDVVRVRRSLDNAEQDFTAKAIENGTLEAFVNEIPTTKPADYGSGAAAAYSLRVVSDSYSGPVVKVRRSSDNVEQDFTAAEIDDGSLLTWVGTGGTDNGFVTTWYDQSGNNNDATQATAARQPKIVDAGALVTENGKAALEFDGVDDVLQGPSTEYNSWTSFLVSGLPEIEYQTGYGTYHGSSRSNLVFHYDKGINYSDDINLYNEIYNEIHISNRYNLLTFSSNATEIFGYVDGDLKGNLSSIAYTKINLTNIYGVFGGEHLEGVLQELIFYPSDQSANRELIESEINDYYGIYTPTSDGFVTTWYDQSGNDNHATQTTAANQPKIVDAGVLVTEGGKAAVEFDENSDFMDVSSTINVPMTVFIVDAASQDASDDIIFSNGVAGGEGIHFGFNNGLYLRDYPAEEEGESHNLSAFEQNLISAKLDGTEGKGYINSQLISDYTGSTAVFGFISAPNSSQALNGTIQEIILYPSDQSANRVGIETNINNHYGIY